MTLALVLTALLVGGLVIVLRDVVGLGKTRFTAYFENSNGIYPGDEVRILGVPVGKIETIAPLPLRAKITFWVDDKYRVPANAKAVIMAPSLVSARIIQLTPVYTGGPTLQDRAVITQDRTAVPVEWDDVRSQLSKLSDTLQPTHPGGVSTLGAYVNTVADNLRGRGADVRETVIRLSQSLSILGDHSGDIMGTVQNLSVLVSALHDSTDLMRGLNRNFAAVTALLADDPGAVGRAIADLDTAVTDVHHFVADNRESLGTTSDKLAEVASALGASLDDIKQALHLFPNTLQNFNNVYQPAQGGAATSTVAAANFQNPVQFMCAAIEAASRLNAEQSAKLCVQYLAPIIKNRQYNFPGPLGENLIIGATARPNEVTYSEDWLRPDYVPPGAPPQSDNPPAHATAPDLQPVTETPDGEPPAPQPIPVNPAAGLRGLMVPQGAGS